MTLTIKHSRSHGRHNDTLRIKYYATRIPTKYDKVKVDADSEERVVRLSLTLLASVVFLEHQETEWPL